MSGDPTASLHVGFFPLISIKLSSLYCLDDNKFRSVLYTYEYVRDNRK